MVKNFDQYIVEGGNVRVLDVHGQEHGAHKLDLTQIKRSEIRKHFIEFFKKLNQMFHQKTGEPIWKDESIIDSGHVFNGSSEAFFQGHISDEEYSGVKKMVGDIDVTVPEELKRQVWDFLNGIKGHRITNFISFTGHNKPTYSDRNAQVNALFRYQKDGFDLNLQIDFEFLPYDSNNAPKDFSKFSHSSDWKDLKAGLKGVHHKYLLRALAGGSSLKKNIQLVSAKTGKPVKTPEEGITFNKFSVDRGLRTGAYAAVKDEAGGHKMVGGLPAYHEIPTSQSEYTTDVATIARHMLGDQVTDAEIKTGMTSFLGIIDLMKKYLSHDQITATLDRMANLYWGHGAQGFERNDPEADLKIKTAGWAVLQKEFPFYKRALDAQLKTYYDNYRMTEITENFEVKTLDEFLQEGATCNSDAATKSASELSDKAFDSDSKEAHKSAAKAHREAADAARAAASSPDTKPGDAQHYADAAAEHRKAASQHAHFARSAMNEGVATFEEFLSEADQVKRETYSWGNILKVSKPGRYGTVLHHKEQQALGMLHDGGSHSFHDEQNQRWHAHREGETIHLTHAHQGYKLSFDRKHVTDAARKP